MFILVCSPTDLFERLCSPPGISRFTLEHSIRYITAKAGIQSSFSFRRRKRLVTNQPDSRKSARLSRISQTLSRFQPRNPADPRPRLPSTEPSPSTAPHSLGSRPCRLIRHQGTSRAHLGLWASDRAGPGPFIDCVVRCPVPFWGLLVYGHWPFSLCPRGLSFMFLMPMGPFF